MTIVRSIVLMLTITLAGLTACQSIKTVYDVAPGTDFSRYRSWAWISEDRLIEPAAGLQNPSYISPIDEQRIRRAVENELAQKGYDKVSAGSADLIVSFAVGSEEKTGVYSTPTAGYYDGYYGYGYGGWYGGSQVHTYQYTEGTLTLQFFDRATKEAVWVGWGSKRLSRSDDPDKLIKQAVNQILAKFPSEGASG